MISIDSMLRDIAAQISGYRVILEPPSQIDAKSTHVLATAKSQSEKPAGSLLERVICVDLACVSGNKISQEDMDVFLRAVTIAMTPTVKFCGRNILPEELGSEIEDGVGHVRFKLHFWDDGWTNPGYETMENLTIKEEVVNGNTEN